MAEQDLQSPQAAFESFPAVGARLRHAREQLGLSRADIAARTKIAERHLAAIEEDRFADLASSTYAVGFSRAYARAVGLDEREIAQAVRVELNLFEESEAPPQPTFEPGDPARVPSSRTAWLAAAGALAVVGCLIVFYGSYYSPAGTLPDLIKDEPAVPQAKPPSRPAAAAPAANAQGPVAFTAREAGVWVRVVDAAGKPLFQKQMALGESFTIPPEAVEPKLRTAWPDALAITIGGRPVPPLSDKRKVMTVPVSAAALLARGASLAPAPAAAPVNAVPAAAAPAPAKPSPAAIAKPTAAAKPAAAKPVAKPAVPQPAVPKAAPPPPSAVVAPAPPPAPVAAPAPPAAEPPKASTVSQ
jgi:transcriptional regulator with XRE-family HTH domain